MMPMPPCCASAMAMCDSVTVSMAALMMGMFRLNIARQLRLRAGLRGNTSERAGSSKHVVESQSFRNGKMNHKLSRDSPAVWVNIPF